MDQNNSDTVRAKMNRHLLQLWKIKMGFYSLCWKKKIMSDDVKIIIISYSP